MCGIAGFINLRRRYSAEEMLQIVSNMANSMTHRGPDDSGLWIDQNSYCAFAHRRLSIIDTSSRGRQPMQGADGQSSLTYNGEFYNFLEVKAELISAGYNFKTDTDTEVLLQLLLKENTKALTKIDGMFAFGFYDNSSGKLLLARDPFGEKPLYYTQTKDYFAFASELSALSTIPDFDATISLEGIEQYLLFQYIPSPNTIYRNTFKLPPGHFLTLNRDGSTQVGKYFQFSPNPEKSKQGIDDLTDELDELLSRSIKRRLISNVPLGAFLSGGVDSSAVVALCKKKLGIDIKTFSMGFGQTNETEHHYAREMAQHLGTEHYETIGQPDIINLAQLIGSTLDEPNGDSSCLPTYLLSKFAREQVTVAISGDGGDEMFGGYGRYFTTLDEESQMQNGNWHAGDAYLDRRILIFSDRDLVYLRGDLTANTANLLTSMKESLNSNKLPLIDRMRQLDAATYLPGAVLAKVDRMSMQHALEVRTPYLNMEIAKFAEKLGPSQLYRQDQGKLVLKRLAGRYIPADWLARKKTGFGLPTNFCGQLLPLTREIILADDGMIRQWLSIKSLEEILKKENNQLSIYQLWPLFILEVWLRSHRVSHTSKQNYFAQIRNHVNNSFTRLKALHTAK